MPENIAILIFMYLKGFNSCPWVTGLCSSKSKISWAKMMITKSKFINTFSYKQKTSQISQVSVNSIYHLKDMGKCNNGL